LTNPNSYKPGSARQAKGKQKALGIVCLNIDYLRLFLRFCCAGIWRKPTIDPDSFSQKGKVICDI